MNTRSLVNILLLALLVVLALAVYKRQTQSHQLQQLVALQRDDITSISIPRAKGDISLIKTGSGWQMQSPYKLRAHAFRIDRLIDMATATVAKQYSTEGLDVEQYGINDHSTRVRFNDIVVRYGSINPVNHKRYVQVNNQLYLIDDELYPLINSQPSSFVDLALLDSQQKIKSIILPEIRIYKNQQGSWQTQPETTGRADSIQELVDNWQFAQAFGVHAYMQRKPQGHIELHLQDDSVINLIISDTSPWLILGRPQLGIEYHFDKSFNQRLLRLPKNNLQSDPGDA